MTGGERIYRRGRVWWFGYCTERVAMKQLGRMLSMFHRYKIVSEAAACGQ